MDQQGSSSSGNDSQQGGDPLASLHRMSTTAGVASSEYVAINLFAILSVIGGVLSFFIFASLLFLIIPVVTLILGLVSLRQIGHSNGTQTGRLGSWLGIILAVGLSATLVVSQVREYREASANRQKVLVLCLNLEQALVGKKYDLAWAMFADRFKADKKLEFDAFRQRFERLAPPVMGQLQSVKSNGLVSWIPSGEPGITFAQTMLVFQWSQSKEQARFPITFVQTPQFGWQVIEFPSVFPTPQQGSPGGGMGMPGAM